MQLLLLRLTFFSHSLCSERALSVSIKGPVEATLPQNTVELNATVNPDDTSGTVRPSAFLNRISI